MKKSFIIVLSALLISIAGFAQKGITWVSLGVKGGYGTSYLFNSSSLQDPAVKYNLFTPSYMYGAKLAFSFNEGVFGLQLEYNNAAWGQNFSVDNGTDIINHSASYKSTGFGLIFKVASLSGFYFELGPQYNLVKSAQFDGTSIRTYSIDQFPSGVIGLGFMPIFGDRVELSLGLRSIISLGNINAVESFSIYSSSPNYNNYTNTSITSIMFVPMVDFTYVFAYMGRASCGRFRIMINK